MLDSYQEKIDSSALIIKWTRRNLSKDVGLYIYIYIQEMSTFETTRVKSPLSLFLSLCPMFD